MRKIALILFLFGFIYGKAQQQELLENNWNLEKVIINSGEHFLSTDSF